MVRAVVKRSAITVPPALVSLFNHHPLVGEEKLEDYENLFSAIAATIKPSDTIVWLLARDFTDLTWEIAREKRLKIQLIKLTELDVVSKLVSPLTPASLPSDMNVGAAGKKLAKQWTGDPKSRQSLINKLAEKGYDPSDISTLAMNGAALEIEAIDRRIGTYELRRIAAMKAIEQYSEASARRLAASTGVIEGEFTEAVE